MYFNAEMGQALTARMELEHRLRRASRFVLKLTEDAMVATIQLRSLAQPILKAADIAVSIDDFGTGYFCLSALAQIQAHELKIDRSFVAGVHNNPTSQRILLAIENLEKPIGMSIVAKGAETREGLDFLLQYTSINNDICPTELANIILEKRAENITHLSANNA